MRAALLMPQVRSPHVNPRLLHSKQRDGSSGSGTHCILEVSIETTTSNPFFAIRQGGHNSLPVRPTRLFFDRFLLINRNTAGIFTGEADGVDHWFQLILHDW